MCILIKVSNSCVCQDHLKRDNPVLLSFWVLFSGPPMEHVREIGRALKCIGDDLDKDQKLQE